MACKEKIKAKAYAVKQRAKSVKAKVKGKVKRGALVVLALALLPLCGQLMPVAQKFSTLLVCYTVLANLSSMEARAIRAIA